MAKTLEQKRAEYAFNVVDKVKDKPYASDFSGLISKMPSYILTNGLGNTIAFLFSKSKEHHLIVAGAMADWIIRKRQLGVDIKSSEIKKFAKLNDYWYCDNHNEVKNRLGDIIGALVLDRQIFEYSLITNELLSLFVWLKRFCDGMIEKGGNDAI